MKDAKLTGRAGIPRDAEKLPAFQSFEEIMALFSPAEIVPMVNHYLRMDWSAEYKANRLRHAETKRLYREEQAKKLATATPPTLPPQKFTGSKLRPGIPLRQQLQRPRY